MDHDRSLESTAAHVHASEIVTKPSPARSTRSGGTTAAERPGPTPARAEHDIVVQKLAAWFTTRSITAA